MPTISAAENRDQLEFDQEVFRSSCRSMLASVFKLRKDTEGLTHSALARRIGVDKSTVSRWFNGDAPNWEMDTIVALANALGVRLEMQASDPITGMRFNERGIEQTITSESIITCMRGALPRTEIHRAEMMVQTLSIGDRGITWLEPMTLTREPNMRMQASHLCTHEGEFWYED